MAPHDANAEDEADRGVQLAPKGAKQPPENHEGFDFHLSLNGHVLYIILMPTFGRFSKLSRT